MRRPIFQLIVVCVGLTIGACDSDSPVQPREPDASSLSLNTGSSGIIASPVSPTEIDLSWRNTGNASGYQIFRSDNGATGSFVLIASTPASVTSYANTGLMGSTQYCYEIRSFRTAGRNTTYSAYSNVECATTFAPPINAPSGVNVVPMPNGWFVDPYISMVRVSCQRRRIPCRTRERSHRTMDHRAVARIGHNASQRHVAGPIRGTRETGLFPSDCVQCCRRVKPVIS